MAQQLIDQCREFWALPEVAPNECTTLLQNTKLYENSLVMMVGGKAQPYVSGTANSSMGGWSRNHWEAPSGADLVQPQDSPIVLKRGVAACAGKASDLPTQSDIGKTVYFDDSSGTVKHTAAANDLGGTLRRIEGSVYWVET